MIGRKSRACWLSPLVGAALLAACGTDSTTGPGYSAPLCWPDFVKLNGITYLGVVRAAGRDLTAADLGEQIGAVTFMVQGNVTDPAYEAEDGDAGLLEPGTPLRQVKGYDPTFRIAAKAGNGIYLYEAAYNPGAVRGSDIFDLEGAVDSIGVYAVGVPEYRLAVIRDPALVESMVQMVSDARLLNADEVQVADDVYYLVAFHLKDGTSMVRQYLFFAGHLVLPAWSQAGHWAEVPTAFSDAIEAAVRDTESDPTLRLRQTGRIGCG